MDQGSTFSVRGLKYFYRDRGEGPPVVMIHGFPDTHVVWRNQVSALNQAGYRTITPDMRGFGETDMPTFDFGYALPIMASDIADLLEELNPDSAHIVGHDFGAAIAWFFAMIYPERTRSLTALSVGYPANMLKPDFEQRKMSWFTYLFQLEPYAEETFTANNWALFRQLFPQKDEIEDWIASLSRKDRFTAALNWYRTNMDPTMEEVVDDMSKLPFMSKIASLFKDLTWRNIQADTLAVWGEKDPYVGRTQIESSKERVEGTWRFHVVPGEGHWLMLDVPDKINSLILEHINEHESTGPITQQRKG